MEKAELDKIIEDVLSILRENGTFTSKSGSDVGKEGVHSSSSSSDVNPFKPDPMLIPVCITDRAVILSRDDRKKCFGRADLTKDNSLSSAGRTVYRETVTVSGPDGNIEGVHVISSDMESSQVELLSGDDKRLGISAPLRLSGDIEASPGIRIAGTNGSIDLAEGAIIPVRKISLDPVHAEHYGVRKGQVVSVEVSGSRGGVLTNVAIVISEGADCFCYLDMNEAAAMCVKDDTMVKIIK